MTESRTTISIIIPAYNRAKLLPECIKSIIHQTYTDWECIIVDDFSTDNTRELVEKINVADKRIRCITNTRKKGAQGARNSGILEAKGEWIAFNDSDDEWLSDKLEKQIKELEKINFDKNYLVHGNCNVFNHQTNLTSYWKLPLREGNCYKQLLSAPAPVFPALLVSKEALIKIDLLDENVPSYQEWDTSIRLSKYCKFIHIQEPLFIYHQHAGETISKDLERDIKGVNYIRMKCREDFIKNYDESYFIKSLLGNIHRVVGLKFWNFGIQLLNEDAVCIPGKQYKYWLKCLGLKVDPLEKVDYFSRIKKMFCTVKKKNK